MPPITQANTGTEQKPLTDAEVEDLASRGFFEGDEVPGRGILTPLGTFSPVPSQTGSQPSPRPTAEASQISSDSVPADADGIVSSSQSVVQDEQDTRQAIESAGTISPSAEEALRASQQFQDILDNEQDRLERVFRSTIDSINENFERSKVELKASQKTEVGVFTNTLARIGGFLGPSASAVGAMNNLNATHRKEVEALTSARNQAVIAAQNAFDEASFAVAKQKAQEAVRIEQEINDRHQQFIKQQLEFAEEQRQAEKAEADAFAKLRDDARQTVNSIIDRFGGLSLDQLDEGSRGLLAEMAAIAGIPGELISGQFATLKEEAQASTEQQREIQNQISLANLSIRQASFNLSEARYLDSQEISAIEASRLGLPRSIVGMSEDQIFEDLNSEDVPIWFHEAREGAVDENGNALSTEELEKQWEEFRTEELKTGSQAPDWTSFLVPTGGGLPAPVQ